MSKLVIISNRVSVPDQRDDGSQGGLAVGVEAALRDSGGIWVGWSGRTTETFTGKLEMHRSGGVTTALIDLTPEDIEEYYNGYANRTLWPLLHYRIDLADFDRHFGEVYEAVNRRIAETVVPLVDSDDVVWVHDYHFLPMAQELRKAGLDNRIGLFLHVPWPPRRLLMALPFHRRLVEAMLKYDLIGFQDSASLENFSDYLRVEMRAEFEGSNVCVGDVRLALGVFPIGIDAEEFSSMAISNAAFEAAERVRSSGDQAFIVGVDRLDYSKGLVERFEGYRRFLNDHPEWKRKVALVQIAPPSREGVEAYQKIREELDELSGRINGEYAELDWQPIRYVNRGFDRRQLAGIFRASRVGLISPLRDGMNLVAKEYVAAQDPDDPGVLILSQFAGAAEQMRNALLINPHSASEISDAIDVALRMPLEERQRRWKSLATDVRENDIRKWSSNYLERLRQTKCVPSENAPALEVV